MNLKVKTALIKRYIENFDFPEFQNDLKYELSDYQAFARNNIDPRSATTDQLGLLSLIRVLDGGAPGSESLDVFVSVVEFLINNRHEFHYKDINGINRSGDSDVDDLIEKLCYSLIYDLGDRLNDSVISSVFKKKLDTYKLKFASIKDYNRGVDGNNKMPEFLGRSAGLTLRQKAADYDDLNETVESCALAICERMNGVFWTPKKFENDEGWINSFYSLLQNIDANGLLPKLLSCIKNKQDEMRLKNERFYCTTINFYRNMIILMENRGKESPEMFNVAFCTSALDEFADLCTKIGFYNDEDILDVFKDHKNYKELDPIMDMGLELLVKAIQKQEDAHVLIRHGFGQERFRTMTDLLSKTNVYHTLRMLKDLYFTLERRGEGQFKAVMSLWQGGLLKAFVALLHKDYETSLINKARKEIFKTTISGCHFAMEKNDLVVSKRDVQFMESWIIPVYGDDLNWDAILGKPIERKGSSYEMDIDLTSDVL